MGVSPQPDISLQKKYVTPVAHSQQSVLCEEKHRRDRKCCSLGNTVQQYLSQLPREPTYQRRATVLKNTTGPPFVEYLGIFPSHVSSHGNSKSGGEYVCTHPRVLNSIKEQETQLSLRDRATRACQLKSGKVLHKCRRLVFEKL